MHAGEQRQAEAEKWLQRLFEARSSSPASFVFLCDELAGVVQGEGEGLPPALASWLRYAATEELENFLADKQPQLSNVQVQPMLLQIILLTGAIVSQSAGSHCCLSANDMMITSVSGVRRVKHSILSGTLSHIQVRGENPLR